MKSILFLLKTTLLYAFLSNQLFAENILSGRFEIVTIRNASDVASTIEARPSLNPQDSPIRQEIEFTSNGIRMQGLDCDEWTVAKIDNPIINLNDPILADLTVNPTDAPLSSGDQRLNRHFSYICEGEPFIQVFQLDDRVIVITWNNSSQYLIAETSLTTAQIKQFQTQLKSMKFYHDEITGKLDTQTLESINSWVAYRLKIESQYAFSRPVITENLLDALGVLDQ